MARTAARAWLPLLLMAMPAAESGAQSPPPEIAAALTHPAPRQDDRPAQQRLAARLSAAAIGTIAREPHRRDEIVRAAVAAAPGAADEIVRRIAAAYPYHAAAIAAAAGRPGAAPQPAFAAVAPTQLPALPAPAPDPGLARASGLASQAIAAIAANPAALDDAVRAAIRAAPQHRETIAAEIRGAYPLFAERIAVAAGLAPQPTAAPPAAPAEVAAPRAPSAEPSAPDAEPSPSDAPAVAETELDGPAPGGPEEIWDPIENVNRGILAVNDAIDMALLRPVAWAYNRLLPDPAILAIRRAFDNLGAPVVFANDVLQLALEDAAMTAGRFAINSTVGVLGLFEVAEAFGLPPHAADFGQTLHSYGVGPGPYVMLPVLGPSTARDGLGRAVDFLLDPFTWLVPVPEAYYLTGAKTVVAREALLEPIDELRASSIDFYGALRSAYYQRRVITLRKGRGEPGEAVDVDELFDAAD